MIALLSPAKSLNFDHDFTGSLSEVRFKEEALQLNNKLKKMSKPKLMELMHISKDLAVMNQGRYNNFSEIYNQENSRAAGYAFDGAVYKGLDFASLSKAQQLYAQDHLRILSGMYGLLRPLDKMQAYRLEMGSKLKVGRKANLYQYWGDKITSLLNEDLKSTGQKTVINLASQEYFKAINEDKLDARLVHVHFKEYRGDALKVISFTAKTARGLMARYMIENQLQTPEELQGFDIDNYHYEASLSDENNYLFVR